MSERYWITGVQLSCLVSPKLREKSKALIVKKIVSKQWICFCGTEKEKRDFCKIIDTVKAEKQAGEEK